MPMSTRGTELGMVDYLELGAVLDIDSPALKQYGQSAKEGGGRYV